MITSENLQQRDVTFKPGDTVRVHYRVIEGNRERIQVFEGLVIARKGGGRQRDVHGQKELLRRRRGEGLPAPFAQDSEDRGRLQGRGAARQALLHQGQGRPQGEGQEGQEVAKALAGIPLEERLPQGNLPLRLRRRVGGRTQRAAGRGRRGGPRRPRGPLAAAAVVLGEGEISGLNDSKTLSANVRESLFVEVLRRAEAASVVTFPAWWIDEFGVGPANSEALRRAIVSLEPHAGCGLADGNLALGPEIECLPRADGTSAAVAAASVVAKVLRDDAMRALAGDACRIRLREELRLRDARAPARARPARSLPGPSPELRRSPP